MSLAYQDAGIWDPVTDSYEAYPWEAASASNFGGGWSQTLQDIAKLTAGTVSQGILLQKNIQGQAYLEGQRIAEAQAAARMATGGIPPLFLLIGGAALLFFMAKD